MKKFIIIILSILLAYVLFINVYANFSHKTDYVYATHTFGVVKSEPNYNYSKKEIRNKLKSLNNTNFYIYKEKSLSNGNLGYTNLLTRTITIDKNIPINKYIEVFCHELIHLKYLTKDERFTTYQTFVTLYNSEFQQVALNMAYDMQCGEYPYEYECYAQIVEYLEKQPI